MAQASASVRLPQVSQGCTRSAAACERGGQPADLVRGLLQQMKGEPLRRLPADPGQPGELGDQCVDGAHPVRAPDEGRGRQLPHLGLHQVGRAALRLGHGREHQVGEQLGVTALERLRGRYARRGRCRARRP